MADGWILLHRKITKNPFWHERPFDKARAWVDMLLLANYSDSSFFVRGQEVHISRGQLAWSEVSLAERWGWSRNKVRRYLDGLKTKQQIEQRGSNLTSLITITKYEEYQVTGASEDTANDTPDGTANDTADDTADGTHKKEGKKKEERKGSGFTPPSLEDVTVYCLERNRGVNPQKWHDFYTSKNWMVGKNKMKDWQAAVRTWEKDEVASPRLASGPTSQQTLTDQDRENIRRARERVANE